MNQRKLERAQEELRKSATPAQLEVMRQVDAAFEKEAADFDARMETENKLRIWAKNLLGFSMSTSDLEEFVAFCRHQPPGIFTYKFRGHISAPIVKTMFGTVDSVKNYISVLERTIVDVTNSSQFTALSFWGLISLAFKRYFIKFRSTFNGKAKK